MNTKRTHVLLPENLLREIDALVGPRGRSSFLVETARQEVRRQKLLQFLENKTPAWGDGERTRGERTEDSAAWVRRLRAESDARGGAVRNPASRKRDRRNSRRSIPR